LPGESDAPASNVLEEAMIPPLHILLVEDNPINQLVATRLLEKAGHSVTVAGNGREAVDRVFRAVFDLVLMDVQMPEMDGIEATTLIRRQEAGSPRRLPIVALTAHATVDDRDRCLEAGMDAYVTKPVQSQLLFQAMAEVLGLARSA
jgi:protein-histidine pros-kinase